MWVSWSPWKARSYSPITTASKGRSGLVTAASSAAALGRSVQGRRREQPTSKYSTTIRPTPAIVWRAESSCQARDDVASWYSPVEIRP